MVQPDVYEDTAAEAEPITQRAPTSPPERKLRGFAAMKARGGDVSAIASQGGKAAHAAGTAHKFSSDEAREAGRKGGIAFHTSRGGKRRAQ